MTPSLPPADRLAAALLCLPLLAVAACSDDGDNGSPGPDGSPSASDSTSSSGPPELPSAARASDAAGAEAFARHWVDALNHASTSGDTTQLRALADDCRACARMADGIDELYVSGGHLESSGWRVLRAGVSPARATGSFVVRLRILRPAEATYASADSQPTFFKGGRQSYALELVRGGGSWRVAKVFRVKG